MKKDTTYFILCTYQAGPFKSNTGKEVLGSGKKRRIRV